MTFEGIEDNVSIETDAADNWKPSKKSVERIDGIVALIMVFDAETVCVLESMTQNVFAIVE